MENIHISIDEYHSLQSPKFISQTVADDDGFYFVTFSSLGKLYTVMMCLFSPLNN
jgi:hypothetical protein